VLNEGLIETSGATATEVLTLPASWRRRITSCRQWAAHLSAIWWTR